MARYAALLRGVSPMNCRMPELKSAFEAAGFTGVKTLLSSGNVVFEARASSLAAIEKKIEAAMQKHLGRSFLTIVRPIDVLAAMIASDPYKGVRLASDSKRIVTFLRNPPKTKPTLPIERDGARILRHEGDAVFSVYAPTPKGPVFMTLIEKAFGKEQTTRTWQTIERITREKS
jgi:uncharacterized protein (DUF1697 family)